MLKCVFGSSAGCISEVTQWNFTGYHKKSNGQMREDVFASTCQLCPYDFIFLSSGSQDAQ